MNYDLVTRRKATTKMNRSEVGKEAERIMKDRKLTSDDTNMAAENH